MADITAIIITKNEEKNMEKCLKSVAGLVSRCVVVDSGSTDRTVEIARANGADTYFHEFEYYARQWNWGLKNCDITTKWVIRLDADERFPEELCREIEEEMRNHDADDVNGFWLYADYYFLGRKLEHGGHRKKKMMVFKTQFGYIEDRRRDAHTLLTQGRSIELKHQFEHYDFKDLDTFIRRYNWYATREAQDYVDHINGKRDPALSDARTQKLRNRKYNMYYKARPFRRAFLNFIRMYFFRGGFRDGKEGLIYHVLSSFWYRFVVDAKIYEYTVKGKAFDELRAID